MKLAERGISWCMSRVLEKNHAKIIRLWCGPGPFERLVLLKVEKHGRIGKFYKTGAIEKYLNP